MSISFILVFTDGAEGVPSFDFDTLDEAVNLGRVCNRPAYIREVGRDDFSGTWIDRVRVIFETH